MKTFLVTVEFEISTYLNADQLYFLTDAEKKLTGAVRLLGESEGTMVSHPLIQLRQKLEVKAP